MTTAETITDDQIEAIRTEAAAAGDDDMFVICNSALNSVSGAMRAEAREDCAQMINEAAAWADDTPPVAFLIGDRVTLDPVDYPRQLGKVGTITRPHPRGLAGWWVVEIDAALLTFAVDARSMTFA